MKLTEPEMRRVYQLESTSQVGILNELHMTCRYSQNRESKATTESLMAKIRTLSNKECMALERFDPDTRHMIVFRLLYALCHGGDDCEFLTFHFIQQTVKLPTLGRLIHFPIREEKLINGDLQICHQLIENLQTWMLSTVFYGGNIPWGNPHLIC